MINIDTIKNVKETEFLIRMGVIKKIKLNNAANNKPDLRNFFFD